MRSSQCARRLRGGSGAERVKVQGRAARHRRTHMISFFARILRFVSFWSRVRTSPTLRRLIGFEETLWTRKVPDEQARKLIAELRPSTISALEVSGRVWHDFGFQSYRSVHYPDFDVCRDVLPASFDLIIAEHVFEHLSARMTQAAMSSACSSRAVIS